VQSGFNVNNFALLLGDPHTNILLNDPATVAFFHNHVVTRPVSVRGDHVSVA